MGIAARLAGRHVLITGATGFVGEALLARLLTVAPDCRVSVLVRPRPGQDAAARVAALLSGPGFAGLPPTAAARVTPLSGDLEKLPELPTDLDAAVHCAGEVSFDPPLPEAFATNVHGALRVAEAVAASCGEGSPPPHLVHISTAFVGGRRRGVVPEARLTHSVDWRSEARAAARMSEIAEDTSRTPAVLAALGRRAHRAHRREGPLAVAAATEQARADWVRERLVSSGTERARSLGWTDGYTFTKALGERAVEETGAGLPLSIVRPAIIESALRLPHPGWIQGFKMAEPIILAFGRGDLPEFPGAPDAVCDIVPIDHVVSAVLATLAAPLPEPGRPRYLHVSSGQRNPLTFHRLYLEVRRYFTEHPLESRNRGHAALPSWDWPGGTSVARRLALAERAHDVAGRALAALPATPRLRSAAVTLDRQGRRLEFLRRYHDLYRPYAETELSFSITELMALHDSLDLEDQREFGFDPAEIDWGHYLREVHCPAVSAGLRALATMPRRPVPLATFDSAPAASATAREPAGCGPVLAVFDLDGTLLDSTVVHALWWLRTAGRSPSRQLRETLALGRQVPGFLLADAADRSGLLRAVYRSYEGADVAALAQRVDAEADRVRATLRPAAVRAVRRHRAAGHLTVLVTGAIRELTRPLAPLFDHIEAASLAVGPDGRATGFLAAPPPVGELRAAWLRDYAAALGADLALAYGYADSASDLPLLTAVGHPVAVDPEPALARTARSRRWPVVHWRDAAVAVGSQ